VQMRPVQVKEVWNVPLCILHGLLSCPSHDKLSDA